MQISATVRSSPERHAVEVTTAGTVRPLAVPPKPDGRGSAVNGGEFLMLALATCYCNDLYREAALLGIPIDGAEVEAEATFSGVGLVATDVRYRAHVTSSAPASEVERLLRETDAVAEVHNTLRRGVDVRLVDD
jgi:organic hydroperoxide reductase OsmC/OhrA